MTGILPSLDIAEDWEKRKAITNRTFHEGLSSKERLRLHVASTYLSKADLAQYVYLVHPEYVKKQGDKIEFIVD